MDNDSESDGLERRQHPVLRYIGIAEQTVGAVALLIIFVLVFVQALQRYLPVTGWAWTGELAQYCLVWLTFSMVGYLFGRGEHITLQVIDNVRSPMLQRAVQMFACLVVALIAAGFVIEGYALVTDDSGQVSPALQMPLVWLYVVPLLGFALTAIRGLIGIFASLPSTAPSITNEAV